MSIMQAEIKRLSSGPRYELRATAEGVAPDDVEWLGNEGATLTDEERLARDAMLRGLIRQLPDNALLDEMHRRAGLAATVETLRETADSDALWEKIRAAGNAFLIALSSVGIAGLLAFAFRP